MMDTEERSFAYLLDKKGRSYRLSILRDGDFFDAQISWKNTQVAMIRWFIDDSNTLILDDIHIFEPPLMSYKRLLGFIPIWHRKKTFRGLGLGSAMLEFVITQAQKLKVEDIWGLLTQGDKTDTPYLVDLYERHGFTIHDNHIYLSI